MIIEFRVILQNFFFPIESNFDRLLNAKILMHLIHVIS